MQENKPRNLHSSIEKATRDVQTTNFDSTPIITTIDGVEILSPVIHNDHRGRVFEIWNGKNDPNSFWEKPVVYSYVFSIRVNQIKGWGLHEFKDDRYTLIKGEVLNVLFDARTDSKTFGMVQKVYLSEQGNRSLKIPTGVWHCNINISETEAMLVNFPTKVYNHLAPDRLLLPWNTTEIPVDLTQFFPVQHMSHCKCCC
jgi:dTDP-4-dehydrorhamnose 3,5-epimerase